MRVLLAAIVLPVVACGFLLAGPSNANGQNVYQDYWANRTGSYSPQDPWQKGHVFRTHTGHDGLFYNCDGEEEKRCSPWIRWGNRPCDDVFAPSRIRNEYKQSLCNALERLKLGSCQDACGVVPGTGYPPGAGYGHESHVAPPEPQPTTDVGQLSRRREPISIVDLPSINHLSPTPR
ncbi:MAG: hypothetical protein Q8M16_08255 [Pirellulaceae bacterium]|nr:hypothetical protein [Pirellulaceae bacterium]